MRRFVRTLLLAAALGATLPVAAHAADPPPRLRNAGVSVAEWNQVQARANDLSRQYGLTRAVILNLAVEGFGAAPGKPIEFYLQLLEEQVKRLPETIAAARALDPGADPELQRLKAQAVAAAEDGRPGDAKTLLDQYAALYEKAAERIDLTRAENFAAAGTAAYTAADYLGAAERYAKAAARAPESAVEVRWQYLVWRASALCTRGELFSEPEALREAVRVYEAEALPLAPRASSPTDWAITQNGLGTALFRLGERGDDAALARAVAAFESALTVQTRERDPAGWAMTQGNLGNALTRLGERGDDAALARAVAAYEGALTVQTRERDPAGWALTQMNLGNALRVLGGRGDDAALARAVAAYENALTVLTREHDPAGWAATQNNLGNALSVLGERGDDAALARAVAAFEAALTVMTRERDPAGWAKTQMNLGLALTRLGERGDDAALARAVAAFESALTVRTRARDPAGWAMTQNNLGNALLTLGERGDDAALARTVAAYERALTVRTRERDPAGWAVTQTNLGNALFTLGERGDDAALARAVAAYERALTVRTRERDPAGWAVTQMNLGVARVAEGDRAQAHGRPARAFYDQALAAYRGAAVVFTPERAPAYARIIADNIAIAERKRAAAKQ